jgi:hypothetical protein
MPTAKKVTLSEQLKKASPAVRPIMEAARRTVKAAAPDATEVVSQSEPPRAATYMWKLVRYSQAGEDVVGLGTFTKHSAIVFYRGRELDDGSGLLQGSGKDSRFITLKSPADAERPAVKTLVRKAFKLAASG